MSDALTEHFTAALSPAAVAGRLAQRKTTASTLEPLLDRLDIHASRRGLTRIQAGVGRCEGPGEVVERARQELREYLAGRRTFFSVPLDVSALPPFQTRVLAAAQRIPFGRSTTYAALAAGVGRPGAARAVGNALAANPLPLVVPCHRVVRSDGSWGPYALGAPVKTRLLELERRTPPLVGSTTTGLVCRRGCVHERAAAEERRMSFEALVHALAVGYRPCPACQPPTA